MRRRSDDRVIAGVCSGLARTLGIDPIIVRVAVAAFTLAGGAGLFAYIIAWILIPEDGGSSVMQRRGDGSRFAKLFLVVLVAGAGMAAVSSVNPTGNDAFGFVLFALLAVVAWQAFGNDWFRRTTVTHDASTTISGVTVDTGTDGQTVTVTSPLGATVIQQEPKSILGRVVWNILVVFAGGAIALNWAGATDIPGRTIIAIAAGIVGIGLIASAFAGRARGLIALGIVLSLFAIPAGTRVDASSGDITWLPTSTVEAQSTQYELGVGTATLDLTQLAAGLTPGTHVDMHAHVAVGELIVLVPVDARTQVTIVGHTTIGNLKAEAQPDQGGLGQSRTWRSGPDSAPDLTSITVEATVDVGQVTVQYQEMSVIA